MATYGLQIVSPAGGSATGDPVAGIDDPGPGVTVGEITEGNGGGPAAGIGIEGRGGGVSRADSAGLSSSVAAALLATPKPGEGRWAAWDGGSASAAGAALADIEVVAGTDPRNSEIGFQEDFASSQARSVGLKLPSAILSRMADSEKRPANCPFR
jgi:hypothetical protein